MWYPSLINQSARWADKARRGAEFFTSPASTTQRRYEALRAYFVEGRPAADVAAAAGYSTTAFESVVRDFRAGDRDFFLERRPGPKVAPSKEAARTRIVQLRRAGHSIDEIAAALALEGTPLNRTGISEVIAEEGFERLWRRPELVRGAPRREVLPRARVIDFAQWPDHQQTKVAGLLLAVPELVALDLPGLVAAAGYPGTSVIPGVASVLSLLALKLVGTRRVSHVDDLAADPGAALFAGLVALPKATSLTTYSYRLSHQRQLRFLAALDKAMLRTGLAEGADFDLDFHAVMHWGEDAALEKHYVPRRSQRTRSVLTFFAQDADTHNLVYANADISKASQPAEAIAFCDYWHDLTGHDPSSLVFDSKVCTQDGLARLDERGVRFLTLRMRSPSLLAHVERLEAGAWRTVALDRDGNYRKPQVVDETVRLSGYPRDIRQLVIRGLGREAPTILITNDRHSSAKQLIERYARRMTIEQRLAESIRSFHLDALASAVPLNVDLDVVLSVLAGAVCASLRRRLGAGYAAATPDTLQRRFLSTGPAQLQPIDAAAAFRVLVEHLPSLAVHETIRQAHLWEREALSALRAGRVGEAIRAYAGHDRIRTSATAGERRCTAVRDLLEATARGEDTVILAHRRAEVARTNGLARAAMEATGRLSGPPVTVRGRELRAGDVVMCTENERAQGLVNGLRGRVSSVDATAGVIQLDTGTGRLTAIDTSRYDALDYAYAMTAHKAQGLTVGRTLVLAGDGAGREWAYTALSRARSETVIYAVEPPVEHDLEGARQWRVPTMPVGERLAGAWARTEGKDSTLDLVARWPATDAHRQEADILPLRPASWAPRPLPADDPWSTPEDDLYDIEYSMEMGPEL